MSEISERYRKIAAQFTERAQSAPPGSWDNPAPCDGWVARDVVRHMAEWMPGMFFSTSGVAPPEIPSVDDDPVGAWTALDGALQACLDDPSCAVRELDMQMGRYTMADAIDMFATGDVLVHTWDLARATGQDEKLDPGEVHRMYEGMKNIPDEVLRGEHFGPRVEVPDDADEQTKLIAFTGRHP